MPPRAPCNYRVSQMPLVQLSRSVFHWFHMSTRLFSECAQNELRRRSGPVYTTTLKCHLIRWVVYLFNFWRFLAVCEIATYSSSARVIKLRW